MGSSLYISTTETGSGKVLISLGMINSLLRKTSKVNFFRPIIQDSKQTSVLGEEGRQRDEDIHLILENFGLQQTYEESFGLFSHQMNSLMGRNLNFYHAEGC